MDPTIIGALIVASATVSLFNLTRLLQADNPKRKHPIAAIVGSHSYPSPEEYEKRDKKYKIDYMKKMAEYLATFLIPATMSALSLIFIMVSDFDNAILTLGLGIFLTIISVAYQKIRLS